MERINVKVTEHRSEGVKSQPHEHHRVWTLHYGQRPEAGDNTALKNL